MLNSQSRLESLVIWLAIAYIAAQFAWTLFAWPPLHVIVRAILDSEGAAMASRNQTLIGSIVGLGGLAFAYLANGWRDRAEARHAVERRERRLAGVMAREAEDIATATETAARQLASARTAGSATRVAATIGEALKPATSLLIGGSMADVAVLGAGAAAATRALRTQAAELATAAASARDDAASARTLAVGAMGTAAAARDAARVLGIVAARGPAAGDRLRLMPAPSAADIEAALGLNGEASVPSRLQPAA